jgi:hypothetical protein
VLLEVLEAVSLSIWVVWLIIVLRSSSSSSQSIGSNGGAISVQNREFSDAGKFSRENYNKEQAGHDLYYLWQHLHYIWPRRAPHRPNRPAEGLGLSGQATRPGFSAGLLRALSWISGFAKEIRVCRHGGHDHDFKIENCTLCSLGILSNWI